MFNVHSPQLLVLLLKNLATRITTPVPRSLPQVTYCGLENLCHTTSILLLRFPENNTKQ